MSYINGDRVRAFWYDPREGNCEEIGEFGNEGIEVFTAAVSGPDCVSVLDNAASCYPPPDWNDSAI